MAQIADAYHEYDEFTEGVTSGSSSYEDVSQAVCTHSYGEISLRQVSSNPDAVGRYRIENLRSGAIAYFGAISDGGLGVIDGVVSGTHQLAVRRHEPRDTNGSFSPGSGVTTFNGRYRCP